MAPEPCERTGQLGRGTSTAGPQGGSGLPGVSRGVEGDGSGEGGWKGREDAQGGGLGAMTMRQKQTPVPPRPRAKASDVVL